MPTTSMLFSASTSLSTQASPESSVSAEGCASGRSAAGRNVGYGIVEPSISISLDSNILSLLRGRDRVCVALMLAEE